MTLELSEDLLSAYLDDELDAETRAAVAARLAVTPDWGATLDAIRVARDAVRALPAVDLPPEAWTRVLTAVAADDVAPVHRGPHRVTSPLGRARRRPARWAAVGAAAAVAAVVAATLVVPSPTRVTPRVSTLSTEHATRASLAGDPISTLAGASLTSSLGR